MNGGTGRTRTQNLQLPIADCFLTPQLPIRQGPQDPVVGRAANQNKNPWGQRPDITKSEQSTYHTGALRRLPGEGKGQFISNLGVIVLLILPRTQGKYSKITKDNGLPVGCSYMAHRHHYLTRFTAWYNKHHYPH